MSDAVPPITEGDLLAYADGRLEPARTAAIETWLALPENANERVRVERWRQQGAALRAALDPVASEPVPAALRTALTAPRRRAAIRWWIPASAAAVLGIAIGLGGALTFLKPEPAIARELADIGMSAHAVYSGEVRHPVEVGVDDETHLVNWLSNRLDMRITPPDLTAEGLTLLGGRLIPDEGKPAAQLMYEDASGRRYTLFIARNDTPVTTAFRYAWEPDICAYYWMDGTVGYVFSGPEDQEWVLELTRAVYDQLS